MKYNELKQIIKEEIKSIMSENTIKPYKLGDDWDKDFDYYGMLSMGETANATWDIKKLKKLASSFTDVNYHTISKPLYNAIEFLEDEDKQQATKSMKKFNKLCAEEYSDNKKKNKTNN